MANKTNPHIQSNRNMGGPIELMSIRSAVGRISRRNLGQSVLTNMPKSSVSLDKNSGAISCIDLFCGAGGLTHGLELERIPVVAGIDMDAACGYPYEANNTARFIHQDVSTLAAEDLKGLFGNSKIRILAGCAPCQPFSSYSQKYGPKKDGKWGLLYEFARLVQETRPEIVTMENVPTVELHAVFSDFVDKLDVLGYKVWHGVVDCSSYGVPQARRRLVLLASRLGNISLVPPKRQRPKTVRQAIAGLKPIGAGESSPSDPLHVAASLSQLNLRRIRASKPGGTWREWPKHLVAKCHKSETGKTFPAVYGRMEWDYPAPTLTTQCYGFGSGRFGHPEQDRAISLREAALLQSFPKRYVFVPIGQEVQLKSVGRLIGNAVPVNLGRAIGRSIREHIASVAADPKLAKRTHSTIRPRAKV